MNPYRISISRVAFKSPLRISDLVFCEVAPMIQVCRTSQDPIRKPDDSRRLSKRWLQYWPKNRRNKIQFLVVIFNKYVSFDQWIRSFYVKKCIFDQKWGFFISYLNFKCPQIKLLIWYFDLKFWDLKNMANFV